MTTTKQKIFGITAQNGVHFIAHRLTKGERYGLDNCLTWDGPDAIEFYDARFPHYPYGQFVSRYYLDTLKDRDPAMGINLDGGVPNWSLDGESLKQILSALGY